MRGSAEWGGGALCRHSDVDPRLACLRDHHIVLKAVSTRAGIRWAHVQEGHLSGGV